MIKFYAGVKVLGLGVALGYLANKYLTDENINKTKNTIKNKYEDIAKKIDERFSVFKDSPQIHDEEFAKHRFDPRLDIQFADPICFKTEMHAVKTELLAVRSIKRLGFVTYKAICESEGAITDKQFKNITPAVMDDYGWTNVDDIKTFQGPDGLWRITTIAPTKLNYDILIQLRNKKEDVEITDGELIDQ